MPFFVPEGYQATSDAILSLAATQWPERWATISAHERSVWHSLNKPGGVTIYKLERGVAQSSNPDILERYCDFNDSANLLRQKLFNGEIGACFCDERGVLIDIQKGFWGSNAAEEALFEGILSDTPSYDPSALYARLILVSAAIPQDEIDASSAAATPNICTYRTGAPGRPSPIGFVEREFERRCEYRLAEMILKDEAQALESWCVAAHPNISSPSWKTVANRIRRKHQAYKTTIATQL